MCTVWLAEGALFARSSDFTDLAAEFRLMSACFVKRGEAQIRSDFKWRETRQKSISKSRLKPTNMMQNVLQKDLLLLV